ncbi:radical SAM protein [Nonomuraea diastatica]|uniref:Radical SAM protein n=1 Tax=Nonomuraea diastatica TaxID=1848329 RepID=A0A4R4WFP0_9ACTN|nr:radical SAM protein [Nonomuraea diastatica]TDD15093.1 radical SAM protein [Nonomuraea diastatica]
MTENRIRADEAVVAGTAKEDDSSSHYGEVIRTIGERPEPFEGEEFWNSNIIRFDAETYVVSHRAILTLVVVSKCNAACRFCSNEITFTPAGPYLSWGPKLQRVKSFALTAGVRKVAYTGGEPTLSPQRLFDLAQSVNPGFDKSRLHTNGIGLGKSVQTPTGRSSLLDGLISVGLSGVSVSVAHFDPDLNAAIMRFGPSWKGMTDADHRYVTQRDSARFTPRLSCVMTPEGVSTVSDMFDYMKWGRELGYRRFIFRSCSEIPEAFRKPTDYSVYNAEGHIPIDSLVAGLDQVPGLEKTFVQRKSDSKVDCYRWGDIEFDVDESSEEPNPDRKIRRLNVMPNGVSYVCWIDPLAVLFEDERPVAAESMKREFGSLKILGQP